MLTPHLRGFCSGQFHFRREIGKFIISVFMQSTAESSDRCGKCEWALNLIEEKTFLYMMRIFRNEVDSVFNSWFTQPKETEMKVWPDLAKFRHFGKRLKIFGNFLRVWEVVVAQLVKQSLSKPEVHSLTPVIGKILLNLFIINCIEKTKIN